MMNLKLRTDILSKSLIIEDVLSGILSIVLGFPKDSSATLGHMSSAFTFKAKTELLKDLKLLKAQQYKDLIMFMEIRNQLVHNLATNTLLKAVERSQKTKKLLEHNKDLQNRFNCNDDSGSQEDIIKIGVNELYHRSLNFLKDILRAIIIEADQIEKIQSQEIQTEFLIEVIEFIKNAIKSLKEIHTDYSDSDLKEIEETIFIFFWQQVQKKHPNIFREIRARIQLKQKNKW